MHSVAAMLAGLDNSTVVSDQRRVQGGDFRASVAPVTVPSLEQWYAQSPTLETTVVELELPFDMTNVSLVSVPAGQVLSMSNDVNIRLGFLGQ